MEEKNKQPHVSCVCMTCGTRNDHSHPLGFCRNGHDNWIEMGDVAERNETFDKMLELTGMKAGYFTLLFLEPNIKQFPIQAELFKEEHGTI